MYLLAMLQASGTLPLIESWGQLTFMIAGAVLTVKYVVPLIRNGGKTEEAVWRGRVEQLLQSLDARFARIEQLLVDIRLTQAQERGDGTDRSAEAPRPR